MLERFGTKNHVEALIFNGPLLNAQDQDVRNLSHSNVPMPRAYEEALKLYMADPCNAEVVTAFLHSPLYIERHGSIELSAHVVPQNDDTALSA
jgi:hypothetical protein